MADDVEALLDEAIADGYRRIPATTADSLARALAAASIDEEPW